jgi:hypothetical protein
MNFIIAEYTEPPAWALAIAAIAANQLMTVGIAHDTHHERRVQVSVGAVVVAETVFTDGKSETALKCVYSYRKMLGIEMEG